MCNSLIRWLISDLNNLSIDLQHAESFRIPHGKICTGSIKNYVYAAKSLAEFSGL